MAETHGAAPEAPKPAEPVADPKANKPESPNPDQEPVHDAAWWEGKAKAMEAENKRAFRKLTDLEIEKARQDAELTELQRLRKENEAIKSALAVKELEMLQRKVAEATGLPVALASRLMGKDEEEMKADALKMLEILPKPASPTEPQKPAGPIIQPTNPPNGSKVETLEQQKERLHMTSHPSIFGKDEVEAQGGGAFFVDLP
jgi:hypothetical protein